MEALAPTLARTGPDCVLLKIRTQSRSVLQSDRGRGIPTTSLLQLVELPQTMHPFACPWMYLAATPYPKMAFCMACATYPFNQPWSLNAVDGT